MKKDILSDLFNYYAKLISVIIITTSFSINFILTIFLPKKIKYRYFRTLAKYTMLICFKLCFFKINIQNRHHIPKGTVIFAANHDSVIDNFVLLAILNRYFFQITAPLDRFPWYLQVWIKYMGYLPTFVTKETELEFKKGLSKDQTMYEATKRLISGESMVIFPEGQMSRGQGLLKFKTGAVRLAIMANIPVVPLAIIDGYKRISPDGYINYGKMLLRFGKPIYYKKTEDFSVIRKHTKELRGAVLELLNY